MLSYRPVIDTSVLCYTFVFDVPIGEHMFSIPRAHICQRGKLTLPTSDN